MAQFRSAEFLTAVSDIHVLIFMATIDIMPIRYVASCNIIIFTFEIFRHFLGPDC